MDGQDVAVADGGEGHEAPVEEGPGAVRGNVEAVAMLSYDRRPATEGAPTNDYGSTFALGWTF